MTLTSCCALPYTKPKHLQRRQAYLYILELASPLHRELHITMLLKGSSAIRQGSQTVEPGREVVLRAAVGASTRSVCIEPKPRHRPCVVARAEPSPPPAQGRMVYPSVMSLNSSGSMDYADLYSDEPQCPLGGVAEVMRSAGRGLLTCLPNETLQDIIPRLSKVTGLPVLSDTGRVVGVISRRDIIRVRRRQGSLEALVKDHMTSPAITIATTASVSDAAKLMLQKKIRRLPVVDDAGFPVGILARSDIFKPLFKEQYMEYMDREVAQLQGLPVKKMNITWSIKYLFDGDCPMCQSLKAVLERQDRGRGLIKFVDISKSDYDPTRNMGIEYEEAMETIHAIKPNGEVLYGTDALRAMFDVVGLGWAVALSEKPMIAGFFDKTYDFLSANRLNLGGLGGTLDAVIAAKRIEMSKKGMETCGDMDEECAVEW